MNSDGMDVARAAWLTRFGGEKVRWRDATLDRYARTTQPNGARPACVLYPETKEEVAEIMRIATAHGAPVYPISTGRNWGYGDACAPSDGMAILDLSRMNRILEIDAELGYAVVEPGVTQRQLYARVQQDAPGYWIDCTGAGDDASLVGNAMERGFGHTPYGDHVRTTCGLEVVLPDGALINTGFGHYPNAAAAHVYPYGVGPMLDGLFMQSNLGIVTKMGLWLYPKPDAFRFFFIKADRDDALAPLVDALRPLRMRGLLNSALHIGNDLRIISSLCRYPWEEANGVTPLPEPLRLRLRKESGLGAWNVSGAILGTRGHVRDAARALRAAVGSLGSVVFVDDRKLALGRWAVRWLQRVGLGARMARQLAALEPNYGLLKGIPTNEPVRGAQWRLRNAPNEDALDPRDTGCGLMWISPVLPLRGRDAQALADLVAPLFEQHGFEALMTFTMLNERSMVAILNMAFDKRIATEVEAAAQCYEAVMDAMKTAGYIPYRLGPCGMDRWADPGDPFWQTAQRIKTALDPGAILAPGRYIPTKKP